MHRPLQASLAVFFLAAAILLSGVGCGGGGSTGGSGGNGGNNSGGTRPDGTISSQQIVGTAPGSTTARSVANLVVGDQITIRNLAIYVRGVVAENQTPYSGGFYDDISSIVVNAPGVATFDGTTLTAIGVGTGTITAVGAGGAALPTVTLTVSSGRASVSGRIRSVQIGTANSGIASSVAVFLDAGGHSVAEVLAGPNGNFQANVPLTAVRYVADFRNLPNSFYNQFTYDVDSLDYTASTPGCGVALPSLTAGSTVTVGDAVAYGKTGVSPPPPPASGCGLGGI